jgi:hypothetical protein
VTDTALLHQILALVDDPDRITYEVTNGQPFIVLGNVSIAVGLCGQAARDKLATVVAEAAADTRARALKAVS